MNAGATVGTHARRLAGRRLGPSHHADLRRIEPDPIHALPQDDWELLPLRLILHGLAVCSARRPACQDSTIAALCPFQATSSAPLDKLR